MHEAMRMNAAKIVLACSWLVACDLADPRTAPGRAEAVRTREAPTSEATADPSDPGDEPTGQPGVESEEEPEVTPTLAGTLASALDEEPLVRMFPLSAEPRLPQPPPGYGMLELPIHPPGGEELVVHAVAGYEVVAVYAEPNLESRTLGYLRLGTRLMVTEKQGTKGCAKGWHALPTGGFACASKGLVVDAKRPPYFPKPPQAAALDQPLPYRYAFVRKWNSPMWWRIPTADELARANKLRSQREAEREAPAGGAVAVAAPVPAPVEPASADAVPAGMVVATVDPATTPDPLRLPLNPENPWLEHGFFISLSDKVTQDDRSWWYTSRGGYVEAEAAYEYAAKDFSGVELGERAQFPFGYVMVESAKLFEIDEAGGLRSAGVLPRRTFVDLSEEFEVGGKTYMMTTAGQLLRKKDLRLAEPQPVPEGIEPWERWIDVSLAKQMLVAYEGSRPVYVTLVSTGRKGTKLESFETPTGRFRIRTKHVSTTMDGGTASDGNYSIQDVPWTMFFEGSYALHGAFWHDGFGRVRSHGCVNLGPTDARWLFGWSTPFLPEGWHGVHAHEGSPGTTVIVRP